MKQQKDSINCIGIMCGSSMDGMDIAVCSFSNLDATYQYQLRLATTIPYPKNVKELLLNITTKTTEDYFTNEVIFSKWIAKEINKITKKQNTTINYIGFHGHTTFHQPKKGFSKQLGCAATISANTGIKVLTDLRTVDIAHKGQGAPLVPIAEKLLWQKQKAFLNIGGICNISVHSKDRILGFDICSSNAILNKLASSLNKPYDKDGKFASKGAFLEPLFNALNTQLFYNTKAPKSLSNQFGAFTILPLLKEHNSKDLLHTYCHHIAFQINRAIALNKLFCTDLFITGGGAFNLFLIQCIKQYLPNTNIIIPDVDTINYKEAISIALLPVLYMNNEYGILPSVTGAVKESIVGAIYKG